MDRDYLDQYYRQQAIKTEVKGGNFEDYIQRNASEETFRLKDVGITSRVLNHWNNQGILITRKEEKNWKRFSFIDFVWLSIIVKLRDRGTSLADIKKIKFALNENESLDRRFYQQNLRGVDLNPYDFQMPLLQILRSSILDCVSKNERTYLIITASTAKICTDPFEEFDESFIAISLNELISELRNKLGDRLKV